MRCGDNLIRSFAAWGLTAGALLAFGATAQAQRPGGIGGMGGGGTGGTSPLSGGNSLISSSSPAFGGALPGGIATGMSAAPGTPLSGGVVAPAGAPLGGPGAAGGSTTGAGGTSTRARPGVSAYGALGIVAGAGTSALPARAAPGVSARHLAALSPGMQAEFRDLVSRSDRISPATSTRVRFALDGTTVVLRGRAADEAEARALESLLHFEPAVRAVRNEMTWPAP